jgi:hypothetical protein
MPGLLAVSSLSELSVYTLALEDDLPTWTKKWSITYALHRSYNELHVDSCLALVRAPRFSFVSL